MGGEEGNAVRNIIESAVYDWRAVLCLIIFALSYVFVITEEQTHLRKSKPVMLGAGLIWFTIACIAPEYGIDHEQLESAVFHDLEEYSTLMLFLFAAMTYVNSLEKANVFLSLKNWLIRRGFTYKQLFFATGAVALFI